jgi:glycosyltransferase involved in cell wall biosynthesis
VAIQDDGLSKDYLAGHCQEKILDLATLPACTVIIPAYNEEEGLGVVLGKLFNSVDESYEVIVVDDGSTDRTKEIASRFPCEVISHGINRGKAAAMKTGIAAACGRNLVFVDADDTYPVELVPEIASAVDQFDMVLASRAEGRENIPLFNRLGNRIFCALIRCLYGFMTSDPLTGFYGMKKSVLLNMNLDSSGFGVETELAIKSGRMGLKVREIPIKYRPRVGESKLHATRDGIRVLQIILKALALFSPTFFFVFPGTMLLGLGMLLMGLLTLGPVELGGIRLRSNTFTLAAMLSLAGFQAVVFGIGLDLYASVHRFARPGWVTRLFLRKYVNRNTGRIGGLLVLAGIGIQSWLGYDWITGGFGAFDRTNALVASSYLAVVGLQMAFSSSFLSVFVSDFRCTGVRNGGIQP